MIPHVHFRRRVVHEKRHIAVANGGKSTGGQPVPGQVVPVVFEMSSIFLSSFGVMTCLVQDTERNKLPCYHALNFCGKVRKSCAVPLLETLHFHRGGARDDTVEEADLRRSSQSGHFRTALSFYARMSRPVRGQE